MNIADMSLEQRNKKMRNIVIAILVGFFGVMIIANFIMVTLATKSWNGVIETNHYEKGLAYNQTLAKAKQQYNLGWKVGFNFNSTSAKNGTININLTDKNNQPLTNMQVQVTAVRPTHEGYDQTVSLVNNGNGNYLTNIKFPLLGQWELQLQAVSSQGETFKQSKRIIVR